MLIAAAELLEAEGRSLRHWVVKSSMAVSLVLLSGALALGGLFFLMLGIYRLLAPQLGEGAAALSLGAITFILAGGALWSALRMSR